MMTPMLLSTVAQIVNSELLAADCDQLSISGVSIDTRTLQPGDLFIAIKGPNFDGHDYLEQAHQAGAVAALTERAFANAPIPQIVVENSPMALGRLASANRSAFTGTLVAVTGSCGKTSVKEMLQAIFSEVGDTLVTTGNLNNAFGVPLTLLKIKAHHQFAVIEMGTSSPGEIEYIANMGRPDIAVITNAAESHLKDLKTVAGVAHEKGFIYDALAPTGKAVLNLDDGFYAQWRDRVLTSPNRTILDFSDHNPQARCFASAISPNEKGSHFVLHVPGTSGAVEEQPVQLAFWGRHQVANACCAATVATAAGLSIKEIAQGLEKAHPFKRRGQRFVHESGAILIDESYNANPKATQAAVDQLADCEGLKVMVFGDMLDLGEVSDQRHRDIGTYARQCGIDVFLSFGDSAKLAGEAFGTDFKEKGMHFKEKPQLANWLKDYLGKHQGEPVSVMVKGSRGMKMLEIIQALLGADYKGEA